MRAQFSSEFVIDASIVVIVVSFLLLFFSPLLSQNTGSIYLSSACTEVADSVNTVADSNGASAIIYTPLLNETPFGYYNVTLSNGIITVYSNLSRYTTQLVSCGADTYRTGSESFLLSNLAVYSSGSTVGAAYLYGSSASSSVPPSVIYGGGFQSSVTLYLVSAASYIKNYSESQSFSQSVSSEISTLADGSYAFLAVQNNNTRIRVLFPFSKG